MAGQYGYGNQQNPYDQRDNAPGQGYGGGAPQRNYGGQQGGYNQESGYGGQGGYGQQPQHQQNPYNAAPSRYGNTNNASIDGGSDGSNVEMAPLAQNASSMAGSYPTAILNDCRDIDKGIDEIYILLEELGASQKRTLNDADSSSSSKANEELDRLSADTMKLYRELTDRLRKVKSNPDSRLPRNSPQVSRVDRRLKDAIQKYQQDESAFRKSIQQQMARQYRIVRPDASEQEVRAAVEDTSNNQVFSQALMQSDRQGRARAALSAVQDRHKALVKIEQQMVELSQLFQDMDTLVVQQEAAVIQIEQKGEEVVDNLDKGNEEIGVAVNTARKTRKKKWICLGICVAIIVVVIIIVLVYVFVIRGTNNNGNKRRAIQLMARAALPNINSHPVEGQEFLLDPSVASEIGRLMKDRVHMPQLINQ